ncbi:hypothetical protein OF83DRAFT_1263778 [Amylostereum chailletii]|nr:hypothetical protein OF83DRAFT_1263778 [Amylostereum chailletii]
MAFPVPSHLPRKRVPQDISTQILSKVASATTKTLTAELASSWIVELDETILQTKTQIHDRIHTDLPAFEHQLASSKSVQERLGVLTTNVDALNDAVSNPETGLVPTLLKALSEHAALAQRTRDAAVVHEALEYLLLCRKEFDHLDGLANEGRLPEAVEASSHLEKTIAAAPTALARSEPLLQLKNAFRAVKDRVDEQLGDAYSRAVVISPRNMTIQPSVQVRHSSAILALNSIFSSFTPASLSNHLTTLRRDISTHYIEFIATQPSFVSHNFAKDASGAPQQSLSIFPAPPNDEDVSLRLANLTPIFDFLHTNLFPALPPSESSAFKRSLCKPLTKALLQQFLVPLLPSSLSGLPSFLELARLAENVEEQYIVGVLGQDGRDREVKAWVQGIATHFERKRRAQLLEMARVIVGREEDGGRIMVELEAPSQDTTNGVTKVPFSIAPSKTHPNPPATTASVSGEDDGWGFEEEKGEEDGWGFDDEPAEESPASPPTPPPIPTAEESTSSAQEDEDPGDAWGWNDDDDGTDESLGDASLPTSASESTDGSSAWDDDPWGEAVPQPAPAPSSSPQSPSAPKRLTRLERIANKGKAIHTPQPSIESVVAHPPPPPTPVKGSSSRPKKITVPIKPAVPDVRIVQEPVVAKETYAVSARARDVKEAAEAALHEGEELEGAVDVFGRMVHARGALLFQTAVSTLDLFRALYSVKFADTLASSAERPMLFANDCAYLSGWAAHMARETKEKERLEEAAERLRVVGESWFEHTIDAQNEAVADVMAEAEGFVGTGDQERFDECEAAVMRVVTQVRDIARRWKAVLSKTKYFTAVGAVVDAALVQMLDDVLAISDITEVESHRLSELCRILNALEGLFLDDPEQPSLVVAYVPSWLKFSYLSELLEASLADVGYLFDEGALVDFERDELVRLVRALFSETPQRQSLLNKLMSGHPQSPR